MILVESNGTARDAFMLFDNQGNPIEADLTSPDGPQVVSVTLNNVATEAINPVISQALAAGSPDVALVGQYQAEFDTDYAGVAAGDVIVVRIEAVISNKVKTALLTFVVDPAAVAEPFIDVT